MKLRIKGNSIRLRLSQSEVISFSKTGYLEEKTDFGHASLYYALKAEPSEIHLSANFSHNKVTVLVSTELAKSWANSDRVGLENKLDIGHGKQLFLLLEKDFVCLDNTLEDQSDNFPNPKAVC